jgi:DNA-3-methyladenine glycosylase II
LQLDKEVLRSKGISYQKINYLQSLSVHVLEGKLKLDQLDKLTDEEVKKELIQVKGIGMDC